MCVCERSRSTWHGIKCGINTSEISRGFQKSARECRCKRRSANNRNPSSIARPTSSPTIANSRRDASRVTRYAGNFRERVKPPLVSLARITHRGMCIPLRASVRVFVIRRVCNARGKLLFAESCRNSTA